ncbi:MAG: glycerophosphodiester phosphodiesterase [Flavobacteriales bacterium]|nr:glycerophosphodiester phosphodiesterase [Flavobacteriales bacterium]
MKYFALVLLATLTTCDSQKAVNLEAEKTPKTITIQGHRGCRGLLPENSIVAFEKAVELGVTAVEMDVVVSGDNRLVVSHEPWMSHVICFDPAGVPISELEEKSHNLYKLTLPEIQKYTFGQMGHPDYPDQEAISCQKPSLAEVVNAVRNKAKAVNRPCPAFNIELKSAPEGEGVFVPSPDTYADIFLKEYFDLHYHGPLTVQSFDSRLLKVLHEKYPELQLIYLVEAGLTPYEKHMDKLGFRPFGFSPHFSYVNDVLVRRCAADSVHLSVWTVNEEADLLRMMKMGVRDIITDYPDRAIELATKEGYVIAQ